ncbi:hypothetical protein DSECCO2_661240 [anaerobic digester metagenome]
MRSKRPESPRRAAAAPLQPPGCNDESGYDRDVVDRFDDPVDTEDAERCAGKPAREIDGRDPDPSGEESPRTRGGDDPRRGERSGHRPEPICMSGDVDAENEVEEVRREEADQHRIPFRACKRPGGMGAHVPDYLDEEEGEEEEERRPGPVEAVIDPGDQGVEDVELDDHDEEPEVVGSGPHEEGAHHCPGSGHAGKRHCPLHDYREVEGGEEDIWGEDRPGTAPVVGRDGVTTPVSGREHPARYEDKDRHRKVGGDVDEYTDEGGQPRPREPGEVHGDVDRDHGKSCKPPQVFDLPEPDPRDHISHCEAGAYESLARTLYYHAASPTWRVSPCSTRKGRSAGSLRSGSTMGRISSRRSGGLWRR